MSDTTFPNAVPLWAVACLGKQVRLLRQFEGPACTYLAGSTGTLISIQAPVEGWQSLHATVALDAEDPSYEENFAFDEICPAAGVLGNFNCDAGLIEF